MEVERCESLRDVGEEKLLKTKITSVKRRGAENEECRRVVMWKRKDVEEDECSKRKSNGRGEMRKKKSYGSWKSYLSIQCLVIPSEAEK
jgi:hypothetical protein